MKKKTHLGFAKKSSVFLFYLWAFFSKCCVLLIIHSGVFGLITWFISWLQLRLWKRNAILFCVVVINWWIAELLCGAVTGFVVTISFLVSFKSVWKLRWLGVGIPFRFFCVCINVDFKFFLAVRFWDFVLQFIGALSVVYEKTPNKF